MKSGLVGFTVQVGISEINISFGLSIIAISSMILEKKKCIFFILMIFLFWIWANSKKIG